MGRPRKNVLNQKSKKAPKEVAELLAPEIVPVIPEVEPEEIETVVEQKEEVLEAKITIGGNELVTKLSKEEVKFVNDPIEINITGDDEESEPRTMGSLSKAEYRLFLRTGIMPK